MKKFKIKETSLEESLKVFPRIIEFDRKECGAVEFCSNKINGLDHLILSAYVDDINVGYLIAYEKDGSFYCWVTGVDPNYRRMGILTEMMRIFEECAKKRGYSKTTLKTMNNKREMLSYLVKNNWNFTQINIKKDILENEILLEKMI